MAKYSKSQVNYIIGRVKREIDSVYTIREHLRKKYAPKKPVAVTKYEQLKRDAYEKADKEATIINLKQMEYVRNIEDKLMLSDTDFDIEAAIKELKNMK